MNKSTAFSLDITTAHQGVPLMSGDIGYDEYAGTLSTLGYANLSVLKEAPPQTFRYIRIHNIFTSKEGDHRHFRDAGGDPVRIRSDGTYYYDWTIIDLVCQSILDVGCTPFLELGFSPTLLSSLQNKFVIIRRIMRKVPSLYPPVDLNLWNDLITAFCEHILEKFGEMVYEWPCELWNEPDIDYFRGTMAEYFSLWKVTYRTLKDFGMKTVGGPGIAGIWPFLRKFLKFSIENSCIPDFISYHVKAGGGKPKRVNFNRMYNSIVKGYQQIPEKLRTIPIWLTEFDPIVGCERGIPMDEKWKFRNTSFYASWLGKSCMLLALLQQGKKWMSRNISGEVDPIEIHAIFNDAHHITAEHSPFFGARCMSTPFWVEKNTAAGEHTYDPLKDLKQEKNWEDSYPSLHEMQNDLNSRMYIPEKSENYVLKSLPKPIFRAFEYTRYLRGRFVPFYNEEQQIYGVLAKDGNFLNICMGIHADDKLLGNHNNNGSTVSIGPLAVKNFEIIESGRIDAESCNPYETWLKMGSPNKISMENWLKLKKSTVPKPALISNIELVNENLKFTVKMNGNSLNFLRITLTE